MINVLNARLPSEYQEVEYLESSGTQYIDTGVIPTTSHGLKVIISDLVEESTDFNYLGARTPISRFAINYYNGCHGYGWGAFYTTTETFNVNKKTLVELNYKNSGKFTVDGNNIATLPSTTFSDFPTVLLFAQNTLSGTQKHKYKLHDVEITNNSDVVRHFIPCYRKSDSVAGMYDTTSKNLFDYDSQTWTTGLLLNTGIVNERNTNYKTTDFIDILDAGETYTIGFNQIYESSNGTSNRIAFYDENQDFISIEPDWSVQYTQVQRYTRTITVPTGTKYIRYSVRNTDENVQIESGSTATEYKPFPFYTNAGTGTFIKGSDVFEISKVKANVVISGLPNEYQKVKVNLLKKSPNLLKLTRTEWNSTSYQPTDTVIFDYNKMYYMAGSGYIRPYDEAINETITRNSVTFTQTSSSWWGIGFPFEVKPNTKYTIGAKRLDGTKTKMIYTLYNADGSFASYAQVTTNTSILDMSLTITTGANVKTMIIVVAGITRGDTIYAYDIQVEEGQTRTDFKPYGYEIIKI